MSSEITRLTKPELFDHVATINKPLSSNLADNPLTGPNLLLQTENFGLVEWAQRVSANLNQGFGGVEEHLVPETRVFQNSFIAAYDLISESYRSHEIPLPTIATPPDHYTWLGFEESPTIFQMFKRLNERQREAAEEYTDYFEALQTWVGESVMANSTPNRVGVTAIAGAEVYLAFRDNQELQTE